MSAGLLVGKLTVLLLLAGASVTVLNWVAGKAAGPENPWILAYVGLLYMAITGEYVKAGAYGMALAFASYAVANGGFILAGLRVFPGGRV